MNLDWIGSPIVIYGVLAAGGAVALYLALSIKIEISRLSAHHEAECESLRAAVAALEERLREAAPKVEQSRLTPVSCTPSTGLDAHKRAEALRMYKQGADSQTISAALGLKQAEVALLETVHHLLKSGAA